MVALCNRADHYIFILFLSFFFFFFFSLVAKIVDTCLSCEDIARQSCAMVRRWRILGDFMAALCNRSCPYIFALWFLSSSSIYLSFFLALSQPSHIGCLPVPYFHTWCGLSANLQDRCRSETCCTLLAEIQDATRMWVSAQRDGRPAEYRWRPLFNAAKFG